VACGTIFGVLVYRFMNFVVLPLSAFPFQLKMGPAARGVILVGCSLLGGCIHTADNLYNAAFRTEIADTSTLSADDLEQLLKVHVYISDKELVLASIGQMEGISCRETTGWNPPLSPVNGWTPEAAAMTQLKLKVLRAGGNAIVSPTCVHHEGIDWRNNCFDSWTCAGKAVRAADRESS
jgi:hypothetical protein